MSSETTINELAIPASWDAKLILEFLENPACDALSHWMDSELQTLERTWQHASSPNAWTGKTNDRRRQFGRRS
jgi:hypothetical protein